MIFSRPSEKNDEIETLINLCFVKFQKKKQTKYENVSRKKITESNNQ